MSSGLLSTLTVDAQKKDGGAGTLTITLIDSSGSIVKTASTNAAHGTATITYSS